MSSRGSNSISGLVKGLHHITLVTSNQEVNRRFYTEVLRLRRVKLTVNQDDILHRHLFYADEKGTTGSAITFFEWPDLPTGLTGLGSPHHLSYNAPDVDSLKRWKSWLESRNVAVVGPLPRGGRISLYTRDPDGVTIEITTPTEEAVSRDYLAEEFRELPQVLQVDQGMRLTTFNHASPITSDPRLTVKFFDSFLGLRKSLLQKNPDQGSSTVVNIGNEERPDFLRYLAGPSVREGTVGTGSIHHIAMAVEEDEDQLKLKRHLDEVGVTNSGIIDRFWFKSLYFRDPDGNLLEVATKRPGYTADESAEDMGNKLVLPRWLEPKRREIQDYLDRTDRNNPAAWPPAYPRVKNPPEILG